jgi:hypothetical protein
MIDVNMSVVGLLYFEDFGAEGTLHGFPHAFRVFAYADLDNFSICIIKVSDLQCQQSCEYSQTCAQRPPSGHRNNGRC